MRMDREPAGEVLLHCLGVGPGDQLPPLSEGEWGDVIRESARQGITPLLYRRVQAPGRRAEVPPRVAERLRELAIGNAVKSLRLYRELAEVLGALRRDGIDVIVLKGAYLAEVVYGDISLRPMTDVDLLVRKRDLARVEAKLFAMGYSQREQPHTDEDYSTCQHLHPLAKPGGAPIEIHWTIESPTEPFAIDVEGLWGRARGAKIAGVDVLVLSPEDLLLHLCLHTAFHHQLVLGLRGCWDILETIRHCGRAIDWEQLQRRARRWGVEKYVCLTLHLAQQLLGADVPARALAALEPGGFEPRLIALARAEILGRTSAVSVSARFAQMWGVSRIPEKASLLMKTVFPSKKALARMYPACRDARWPYRYYAARWRDLLRQYGPSAWQMARRDENVTALVRREHERAILMDWLKSASL
ncbi:MAG: hypothetical protein DMD96_21610 [Candidatus Rokuibacteriota bacterium]|nr:MAG: hypothetical protein DMD96_21610 [Candidatus Rokubacteria bacterium]